MSRIVGNKPSIHLFSKAKQERKPIVCLTCYDYSTAKLLNETSIDCLLVGDSLAMTMLGHPDTLSVTMDEMLHHVKAVARGAANTWIIADLPFMSYQVDVDSGIRNAGRMLQEGRANAVKLEGASPLILKQVEHLTLIGVPVMGHLGLTPQSINTLGGFRIQGKTADAAERLLTDALALQDAGVYSLVLECIPVEVARSISQALTIPTIGIGAGPDCDGQVLVIDDMLGRYPDLTPKFVRRFLELNPLITTAVEQFTIAVRERQFPDPLKESFTS